MKKFSLDLLFLLMGIWGFACTLAFMTCQKNASCAGEMVINDLYMVIAVGLIIEFLVYLVVLWGSRNHDRSCDK